MATPAWRLVSEMATGKALTRTSLPSVELALAVLGAVCGTVITQLLGASETTKFVGLALGAAIPPFVNAVGRWRPIRATAAVLIAVIAFGFTYVGGRAVSVAVGAEIVPPPPGVVSPTTVPTNTHSSVVLKAGIGVTPSKLACTPVCDKVIVLKSTGTAPLLVDGIEFDGPAKKLFKYTGNCARHQIDPGGSCTLTVRFAPSGAVGKQTARLIVDHNAAAGETAVDLSGDGIQAKPDLTVSASEVTCRYVSAGTTGGKDLVQVLFGLLMSGGTPGSVPKEVLIAVRSSSGAASSFTTPVSTKAPTAVTASLPVAVGDYGRSRDITITLDPGGKIAERDESNNQFKVRLTIPAKPSPPKKLMVTCVDA